MSSLCRPTGDHKEFLAELDMTEIECMKLFSERTQNSGRTLPVIDK